MGIKGRLEIEAVFYANGACSVSIYAPDGVLIHGAFLPYARNWSQVFEHLLESPLFERRGQLHGSGSIGG